MAGFGLTANYKLWTKESKRRCFGCKNKPAFVSMINITDFIMTTKY